MGVQALRGQLNVCSLVEFVKTDHSLESELQVLLVFAEVSQIRFCILFLFA
jgi:hypothetical protein